nr:DUF63 family protein [Halobaculum sp. DT92]
MHPSSPAAAVPTPGQLLPAGFGLPPLPYLLALALALAGVALALRRRDPAFGRRHVFALVPWMCVGAAGHVLYALDALPTVLEPLFGTPSAYLTTAALAGATWLAALAAGGDDARALGAVGLVAVVPAVGAAVGVGLAGEPVAAAPRGRPRRRGAPRRRRRHGAGARRRGRRGRRRGRPLAVAAHGVDAVTTAVGVDLLGFGERTPASRLILEFAADLPTAELLGAGWLFVLVKLAVACVVVVAVGPTVREEPRYGYVLLALVTAVGLGPGVHNAILFAVAAV